MRRRAVFLDKDGTVVDDVPYNADPGRITIPPAALDGLAALGEAGYRLVMVTNQSGIARGMFGWRQLQAAIGEIRERLAAHGIALDGVYVCPHHPDGAVPRYRSRCECRKPAPGLLLSAARDLGLDLAGSWMIGDILDDVEAGRRAGCTTVLLDVGSETRWDPGSERVPDFTAPDLASAAEEILARDRIPTRR